MPERRFTILVTGPFPDADTYAKLLPDNVSLDIIPFIRTSPVTGTALTERLSLLSRKPINAVFTSAEAVRVVKDISAGLLIQACFCTSGPTEDLLRDWLAESAVIAGAPDASGVADRIVADHVKDAVFFCGNQRRDLLPGRLKAAGIKLEEVPVYHTEASPVGLNKIYDAVLFFSPSAVVSFFSANRISARTAVFALGPTTAEALQQRITNSVIVSKKPDKIYLLQKALTYAGAHPIS